MVLNDDGLGPFLLFLPVVCMVTKVKNLCAYA